MIYLVFEIREIRELDAARGYVGDIPQDAYLTRLTPEPVGCYQCETAQEACIEAARYTRRLGNYVSVEVAVMSIDFTASAASAKNMLINGDT